MKRVLITGATSGFGFGLAKALLKEGYFVVASGRNLTQRAEIFADLRKSYPERLVELDFDVTSEVQRTEIKNYFESSGIDILINNAGYGAFGPAEVTTEDSLRHQFEVNFFSVVLLTQSLLPILRRTKGHIINFSSVFGCIGFPMTGAYCASKFAVEGYSESLSHELRSHGVDVTLIEPGGYRTQFGEKIEWSDATLNSPYSRQVEAYKKLRQKLVDRPNPPNPESVVKGVLKIINLRNRESNTPRMAYAFGNDARLSFALKRLLPRNIFVRLIGKSVKELT